MPAVNFSALLSALLPRKTFESYPFELPSRHGVAGSERRARLSLGDFDQHSGNAAYNSIARLIDVYYSVVCSGLPKRTDSWGIPDRRVG